MKMFLCLFCISFLMLLSGCTTTKVSEDWVSAHRLIYFDEISKSVKSDEGRRPKIDVALTNISNFTLCNVKATLVGLNFENSHTKSDNNLYNNWSWRPGGVWVLSIDKEFDCSIPIQVKLTYSYLKPKGSQDTSAAFGVPSGPHLCNNYNEEVFKIESVKEPMQVHLPKRPTAIGVDYLKECKIKNGCVGC